MEKEDEFGLNTFMAEFRSFDPALGRWWQMDPIVKDHESPYAWVTNNPILWDDPYGLDTIKEQDVNWQEFDTNEDVIELEEFVVSTSSEGSSSGSEGNGWGGAGGSWAPTVLNTREAGEVSSFEPISFWESVITGQRVDEHGNQVGRDGRYTGLQLVGSNHPLMEWTLGGGGKAATSITKTVAQHWHHAWPRFLGGLNKGNLVQISKDLHVALHSELTAFLKSYSKGGKTMSPARGNSGRTIQGNFSVQEIQKALTDFYRGPGAKYKDVADQFFKYIGL